MVIADTSFLRCRAVIARRRGLQAFLPWFRLHRMDGRPVARG